MSRELKIVLGVVGGLIVACCLIFGALFLILPRVAERFVETAFTEDSEQAAEVAQSILDYELPDGYSEKMAMSFAGMKMVMITPDMVAKEKETGLFFMLMQFPSGAQVNEKEMQRRMEEAYAEQTGQSDLQMDVVDTDEVIINGETVTLTITEGTDSSGESVRQVTGVFPANDGSPAMLMITGLPTKWDADAYDQFFNSLETGR